MCNVVESSPAPGVARWIPWIAALLLIIADQITKMIVEATIGLHDNIPVIPDLFSLVHLKNRGAAFGLLSDVDSPWVSVGFGVVAVVAVTIIVSLYRSAPANDRLSRIAFVMIGAGAVGNLVDRVRIGSVTDFLLVYIGEHRWPAFNVADSLISVGVVLLTYALLFGPKESDKTPSA